MDETLTARLLAEMAGDTGPMFPHYLHPPQVWRWMLIADRLKERGKIKGWSQVNRVSPAVVVWVEGDVICVPVIDGNYAAALIEALRKACLEAETGGEA